MVNIFTLLYKFTYSYVVTYFYLLNLYNTLWPAADNDPIFLASLIFLWLLSYWLLKKVFSLKLSQYITDILTVFSFAIFKRSKPMLDIFRNSRLSFELKTKQRWRKMDKVHRADNGFICGDSTQ